VKGRTSTSTVGDSAIVDRLVDLAAKDRFALFELTMHCRDRGRPIAKEAQKTLLLHGLIEASGQPNEQVRAAVAQRVNGHGLSMKIEGRREIRQIGVAKTEETTWGERVIAAVERGDRKKAARELFSMAETMASSGGVFDAREMAKFTATASTLVDRHGRITPELQTVVNKVEEKLSPVFSRRAAPLFADMVGETGGTMNGVTMPQRHVPYWLKGANPLANFQSTKKLPKKADIVIIGAGLTGGSAAYHLSKMAEKKGLTVVVLDAYDPATGASGRNGGNFELIPENFFGEYGTYDGLEKERFKFLKASYPDLPDEVLERHAKRIAESIVGFALTNMKRMKQTIVREKIECDYSPKGWVRTAHNEREVAATAADIELARRVGAHVEAVDQKTMEEMHKFPAPFGARLVPENGNYHPFKFVIGELQKAVERGVKLYARTPVKSVISKKKDLHLVKTSKGTIEAKRVIVATNAFTSQIFPEFSDVRPFRSQLASYNHVPDHSHGRSITAKDGDIYFNYPGQDRYIDDEGVARGTVNVGNDFDTEVPKAGPVRASKAVLIKSKPEIEAYLPQTKKHQPVRLWRAGLMAFVEGKHGMRMPLLGPLGEGNREGVFLAVWCNGYGGTGCHNAGAGAAAWALTGRIPKDMPQDVFGPRRLFTDAPQFDTRTESPKE
jgi:glycine/D-amino acid oxidase-like deaminating enzyme